MLLAAAVAFLMAVGLTPLLASWARRRNLLDIPNPRSSHVVATPRIGGSAFILAVLAGLAAFQLLDGRLTSAALLTVGGACAVALLGLVDDVWSLPPLVRLPVQVAVAALLVLALGAVPLSPLFPQWLTVALNVFWIVALTNAYNFMDGIDGIAGGQAIVGGVGWSAIGTLTGAADVALLGLLGAAALAGFLVHNWPPAKVFMGDAGSAFLGFLFAALPLVAHDSGTHVAVSAALLVWPFLFDTGFTLLRRLRRGEDILAAHRSHLYQRLTLTGLPHATVSLLYSALAAVGAGAGIALTAGNPGARLISALAVTVSAFGLWRYVVARESAGPGPPPAPPTPSL